LEAERALLGAILLKNEALDRVSSFLEAQHFFDPLHQQIFETTTKLILAGKQVTPITLKTFFENAEPLSPTLTVPQYLGTLAAEATSIINAEGYGRTIHDLATRRALVIIGEDMANSAYNSAVDAPPATLVRNAERQLDKLSRGEASGLTPITLEGLITMDLPKREWVLSNLLQQRGIAMVYAWRGAGKTWFALGLGYAIASGTGFLKWSAERPRRVLHVCGELPAVELRERLELIGQSSSCGDRYRVLSDGLHENGLPDLASAEGQAALERALGDAEVLVFDNISTLFRSGVENEAESWAPVQQWLLRLRRQGRTVILIHHAGKGRTQRGTAKREDILDLVLNLREPSDYEPSDGARFEVHFEKNRGLSGKEAEPFEAKLETRNGTAVWTTRDVEYSKLADIKELKEEGWTVRQIAKELDLSKSAVHRALKRNEEGQL